MTLATATATCHRIAINDLWFAYGKETIFEGLDFESDARVSVLRGPSGCGKTTLLKLLYGLLPADRAKKMIVPSPAFLVLQADTLVPWFTGRQNIERFSQTMWPKISGGPLGDLIGPFVDKRACDMSYGQRRSIELARALASDSKLLLLDEPFNFLDPRKRKFFVDYLEHDSGSSTAQRVILTSHYVEEICIGDADGFEFGGDAPHRSLATVRKS